MSADFALERIKKILDWGLPDTTTVTRIMEIMLEYEADEEEDG